MQADAALARTLGAHALPAFLIALVVLLVMAGLLWWSLRRYAIPRPSSALPPALFLMLWLALGFGVVVGAALSFAELADALDTEQELGAFDEAFSLALRQSVSRSSLQVFAWLTQLGDAATLIALGIAVGLMLVLRNKRWLALGWSLALLGNAVLNPLLKQVFERVRPVHEHGLTVAEGWSFPSGHASGSVVAYGMLAYVLIRMLPAAWHLPLVLLASALAFTTGASRVFLQVHWPSDVMAGFATGSAWLAVCIGSIELTRYYRKRV